MLQDTCTPWPFHSWGLDIIGRSNPKSSKQHEYIITATEYFTKWVEAIPLKGATGEVISTFIKEHIICCFGIPMYIISDNGTPFVNNDVTKLLGAFRIKQKVSTPYYPQGNGKAESTNKSLLRILSRSLYENKRAWHEEFPLSLMAYRISKRTSTGSSPYILVYVEDVIIPAEVIIASARILSASGVDLDSQRFRSLDMIDERRDISEYKNKQYRERQARFYNQHVKERHFEKGKLVLVVALHVQREGSAGKFAPNWEGPFRICKVGGSGYYKLEHADDTKIKGKRNSKINGTWLIKFYA
ncbi:uncharacterized protein LOC113273056 [Papaver somniferum]|uniref:uncharacterized protein LOC113273056 n=1 Tax=Papaver somniferum TaxID=3469 RepID=UPI000E6FB7EA|nr:uncharacterized protein LOC113273056 [Papaver somniferum]